MLLSAQLARKPLVMLDGAMGAELHRHGADVSCRSGPPTPSSVRRISSAISTSGTCMPARTSSRPTRSARTSARSTRRAWGALGGTESEAVEFAFEARERYRAARPVTVAASTAPVERLLPPATRSASDTALEDEHGRQAKLLALMGAELLLAETMNSAREAAAAARACAATGREFAVSFVCTAEGALPFRVSRSMMPWTPCARRSRRVAGQLRVRPRHACAAGAPPSKAVDVPAGCYANVGPTPRGGTHAARRRPGEHENAAARWASMGARIIGGCCGTTPELLARIAGRLAPLPADMIAAGIHRHAPLLPTSPRLSRRTASTLVEGEPSA
ncbi:MAG: homocysteine S-methyltransferase family protein [Ignavibacteria bacterium]|nr:homocysteine S-methyltransferase family protein [Ignavibacteria bacterium]